jgi:Icc-related predicted phosphoesterase
VIRVAAVGDIHFGKESSGQLRHWLVDLPHCADVLLLAGDLTRVGEPAEMAVVASEMDDLGVPVVAVLGNHDLHGDAHAEVVDALQSVAVTVLEGDAVTVPVDGSTLGIAGVRGFGGGFVGACASAFGEPLMKEFVGATIAEAEALEGALGSLETDARVALMHYSPVPDTLRGERPEIHPFLGSYLLAEAIDRAGADLAIHGHAHNSVEKGLTPGGCHVRNVAVPESSRPHSASTTWPSDVPGRQDPRLLAALKEVARLLRDADIEFAVGGGMATWARGGPPTEHDIDLVIREADVEAAVGTCRDAGLDTDLPLPKAGWRRPGTRTSSSTSSSGRPASRWTTRSSRAATA